MIKNRNYFDMLYHTDIAINFGVLNSKHEIRNLHPVRYEFQFIFLSSHYPVKIFCYVVPLRIGFI